MTRAAGTRKASAWQCAGNDMERNETMIQCPVCKSICFDDMEVCFGCMHRFDDAVDSLGGCMASGLPEFEVEEPRARVAEESRVWLADQGSDPISFEIPADGRGYNVVISILPASGADASLPSSRRKATETGSEDVSLPVPEVMCVSEPLEEAQSASDQEATGGEDPSGFAVRESSQFACA